MSRGVDCLRSYVPKPQQDPGSWLVAFLPVWLLGLTEERKLAETTTGAIAASGCCKESKATSRKGQHVHC